MLLTLKQMGMLEVDGEKHFKARTNLSKEEKAELLGIDNWHYSIEGEHLITNYEELKK